MGNTRPLEEKSVSFGMELWPGNPGQTSFHMLQDVYLESTPQPTSYTLPWTTRSRWTMVATATAQTRSATLSSPRLRTARRCRRLCSISAGISASTYRTVAASRAGPTWPAKAAPEPALCKSASWERCCSRCCRATTCWTITRSLVIGAGKRTDRSSV
jgi:hypothetical protein